MSFAEATAVSPGATEPPPPHLDRFDVTIAEGWDILGNANGGYVLATIARALSATLGRPDPITVTSHYLRPVSAGTAVVDVETVRVGRTLATGTARMSRDGNPLVEVLGAFGDLGPDGVDPDAPRLLRGEPPELPPVEECISMASASDAPTQFSSKIDLRFHPDDLGFVRGQPSGVPRMRGWIRLPEGEPFGTLGVLLAADAFPPTVFNASLPVAWAPTVELTVHVRARPAPGWLRGTFETWFVSGGRLEVSGELWDDNDELVAQSRQIALVPRPTS